MNGRGSLSMMLVFIYVLLITIAVDLQVVTIPESRVYTVCFGICTVAHLVFGGEE